MSARTTNLALLLAGALVGLVTVVAVIVSMADDEFTAEVPADPLFAFAEPESIPVGISGVNGGEPSEMVPPDARAVAHEETGLPLELLPLLPAEDLVVNMVSITVPFAPPEGYDHPGSLNANLLSALVHVSYFDPANPPEPWAHQESLRYIALSVSDDPSSYPDFESRRVSFGYGTAEVVESGFSQSWEFEAAGSFHSLFIRWPEPLADSTVVAMIRAYIEALEAS